MAIERGFMHGPLMKRALEEAAAVGARSAPNPKVGCVLASPKGEVLGTGHTQVAGGPHAEIMALRDAHERGHSVHGATAYVSLEPCSHRGRTGPCCDALIKAGISRVVAAVADPNPLVCGQGFERLRAAGVEIEIGLYANESRELNLGFFSRMIRKTPWVRTKIAASLDGKTALENGESQWITGPTARSDGHIWRARACAILTGIGTILKDNPRLDVRLPNVLRQPHLVLVDSQLALPLDANIFIAGRSLYIYTASNDDKKKLALETRGATVICMANADGQVDLSAMMRNLAEREINELHVEAGQILNGALLKENLIDELLVYLAPKLLGNGQGMAQFGPLMQLDHAPTLEFQSCERVGNDLRIVARATGHDRF